MRDGSSPTAFPESFFGWLDFSAEDAEQMRSVLAAFEEKDTVDSMGLSVIRDGISDSLFPGVSTIQTRARYFFIVPWICQHVEKRRLGKGDAAGHLRWYEGQTIELLKNNPDVGAGDGVIGWDAGSDLKRMPSSVYWNGLAQFGIRPRGVSLSEYLTTVSNGTKGMFRVASTDDGERIGASRSFWDPDLPHAPPDFLGSPDPTIDLTLTQDESNYLAARFVTRAEDSLLAHLANDLSIDRNVDLPWMVDLSGASESLKRRLRHAQSFAEITYGARLLYNHLLITSVREKLGTSHTAIDEEISTRIVEWVKLIQQRRADLKKWRAGIADFWAFIAEFSTPSDATRKFVEEWIDLSLAAPGAIASNDAAKELVIERERRLKRQLARLTNTRALEGFRGEILDGHPYDFRWAKAQVHLSDIDNPKKNSDALA